MIDPSAVQAPPTQALTLEDFSGGITDFYLGGALNKYERADNLVIVKHDAVGKLFTRPGSEILDAAHYQIPPGAQRIGTLIYFGDTLFYHSARRLYFVNGGGWVSFLGAGANSAFPVGVDTTTVLSYSPWNGQLFVTNSALVGKVIKIFQNGGGSWQLNTAGMPALASSPTVTAITPGSSFNYLYRYLYKYSYTVGSVSYVDRGPTVEVAYSTGVAFTGAPGAGSSFHASIPVLANGASDNYAVLSVEVEIYRTTDDGVNFFLVGTISNGTTSFGDNMTDTVLLDQEPLYTEGGAPENDPPPLCKVLHIVDDRGFYGHCKVGAEVFKTRVYQSVPGDIDAVPLENFLDLKDDVVGISSYKSVPIVFCTKSVQRLEGGYDELGGGALLPVVASDVQGCVSQQSTVQTPVGVFWAGLDGFYWTDGYRTSRVSSGLRETYQAIIRTDERKRRIQGRYDSKENRVYWTAQYASNATEVDTLFVLDLNWGLNDNMPLTTLSGGANFAPTAIEFIGPNLVRGDSRGYTFIHRDTLYVDPRVDVSAVPSLWSKATIVFDFITVATSFGTVKERKWVPRISVVCEDETNLSLLIRSINDDGRRTADLKPVRYRGKVVWGDEDIYWGDPDVTWNNQGVIDESRRMPAGSLRCQYKQAQLTNAHVAIVSSDVLGSAIVDAGAMTATLVDTANFDWPSNSVDYYLAFEADGYVKEFRVSARTADVLTFVTGSGGVPSGTMRWVLRGKPKGEVLYLSTLVFHFVIFGETQGKFTKAGTGEVGVS